MSLDTLWLVNVSSGGHRDSSAHHLLKGSSASEDVVMRRSPPQRHSDSFNPASQIMRTFTFGDFSGCRLACAERTVGLLAIKDIEKD